MLLIRVLFMNDKLIVYLLILGCAVALINAALLAFVLLRRMRRRAYYELKDQARQQLHSTVRAAVTDAEPDAVQRLRGYAYPAARAAIEELLLAAITPATHTRITAIITELGYVDEWKRVA